MAIWRHCLRYAASACIVTILLSYVVSLQRPTTAWPRGPPREHGSEGSRLDALSPYRKSDNHSISILVENAQTFFSSLLSKQSRTLEHAAARYRERRGRHPPPGFDKWFEVAMSTDAIIVEDFFDRIYHDIQPFWGLDPIHMRRQANIQPYVIRVRGGRIVHYKGDKQVEVVDIWTKLVREILPHLPDLDMAINHLDEPRLLVPWEDMAAYVVNEQKLRELFPPNEATTEYTDYSDQNASFEPYQPEWINDARKYWDYLRATCPPDSPARKQASLETVSAPIDDIFPAAPMSYMKNGFIHNFTQAQDPCLQPHLRGMHGSFVEAFTMTTSTQLFPFFSGSKLPRNNELLLPGAVYFTDEVRYSGGNNHGGPWGEKKDGLLWRGVASGGRNREDSWWHYHRHRFVQMMNGSTVAQAEAGDRDASQTFNLEASGIYGLRAEKEGRLGAWLNDWSDVGFNRLVCWPERYDWLGRLRKDCPYTDHFFKVVHSMPMEEMYNWKFLPDIDGNSFSGRWRGFLLSTSCPLKATVYTEWHDDRLVPWLHFAPFDNSFMDIHAVMEYFLDGHDAEAQRIAEAGQRWGLQVLRKEDMVLYTWRLLLEYARVLDPKRDRLGFVADLTGKGFT